MVLLTWLAVLPSILLARRVLFYDKIEKEPRGLLVKLFIFGMLTCIPSAFLEGAGEGFITSITENTAIISAFMYLIVVPAAEEGTKYIALRTTRNNPNFNYTFDGIVYAVMVGLGFATLENILYVLMEGTISLAIMRGVLSVPLHCTCAVFMGYHYGVWKRLKVKGYRGEARAAKLLSLAVPWVIHGLYDYALDLDSWIFLIAGLVMTITVFVRASRRVRIASATDQPIMVGVSHTPLASLFGSSIENKGSNPPSYSKQ